MLRAYSTGVKKNGQASTELAADGGRAGNEEREVGRAVLRFDPCVQLLHRVRRGKRMHHLRKRDRWVGGLLGFAVYGFKVQDLGFTVYCLGYMVEGHTGVLSKYTVFPLR